MNKIITYALCESLMMHHWGFILIRISLGIMFFIFGYKKLISGSANITQIGSAIGLFGITYGYIIWGYIAALTELCAGACYIFGFFTRIASLPLIILLIIALQFHIQKNDPFSVWAFPLLCLCIVIGFLVAGSGLYSIDHYVQKYINQM